LFSEGGVEVGQALAEVANSLLDDAPLRAEVRQAGDLLGAWPMGCGEPLRRLPFDGRELLDQAVNLARLEPPLLVDQN
jgi:hypothetical protein